MQLLCQRQSSNTATPNSREDSVPWRPTKPPAGSKWRSKGSVPSEPRSTTEVGVVVAAAGLLAEGAATRTQPGECAIPPMPCFYCPCKHLKHFPVVNGRTLLSRLKGIGALVIECDTRPNRFDLQVGVGASEEDVVELLRSGDPSLSSGS